MIWTWIRMQVEMGTENGSEWVAAAAERGIRKPGGRGCGGGVGGLERARMSCADRIVRFPHQMTRPIPTVRG